MALTNGRSGFLNLLYNSPNWNEFFGGMRTIQLS